MNKLIFFLMCGCASAQSGLNRPTVGKMLDASGAVRTVYGISASFALGDAELTGVLSLACSATLCLAKTDAAVVSAANTVPAPPGTALFAFEGSGAYIWFSDSRQLARLDGGTLTFIDATVAGEVLSIGASAGTVQFAVRRRSGVWIVNQDGSVAGSLPRSAGPVILTANGPVYADRGQLMIGNTSLPVSQVTAFLPMSGNYVQVVAVGANYALRIDPGRESIFQLPGVVQ